ncbi:unnamed protein product [Urochloa decumbens]|uniref:Uncharacterized protein n=1 Tax=Urochloa decumbens TaxID=240449 RepID=A0ABC8X0D0_9POAL
MGRSDSAPGSSGSNPSSAAKGGSDTSPGSSGSNPSSTAKDRLVVLSELLGHIHGYYNAALDQLPVVETPALIPRLLDAGVCFGLMDPVSNIIANTVASLSLEALPEPNAALQDDDDDDYLEEEGEEDGEDEDNRSRKSRKRMVEVVVEEEDMRIGQVRKRKVVAAAVEEENNKSRKKGRKRNNNNKSLVAAAEAQRRREEVMSMITTDASSILYLPPRMRRGSLMESRTVAQRSLEGLVTFLICYFHHLPVSEALHYLLLSKADLLAAVHLIEYSRGMGVRLFPFSSPTMEISLRCAAMSASHPEPVTFASRSLSMASRLEQLSQILTIGCRLSLDALRRLHELLEEPLKEALDSPKPIRQAALRLNRYIKGTNSLNKFSLEFKETLRILLLEKVHVLYLKAIAQLPRDDLRGRYHRGLLKAGHCFGPAIDPVSNIILNTIWFDTAFPTHEEFKMDMICSNSLVRIECRSLNGLLAFLHNLFPTLSEHDALMYLFHSNADLEEVIFRAMCDHDISSSYKDAYKAAADAAWHPHPDAQAEFAVSTRPTLLPIVESSQVINRTLTSSEVELISRYFSQKSYTAKSVPLVPKLVPGADKIVKRNQQKFMANQYFIRRKVKAALKRYAKEKGTEYELHVICGTNCDIPENGRHGYFLNRKGFPYAHVNFLARPKGSQSDNTAPSLFFLECSNGEEDLNTLFLCCTELESPTDSGRCFHCEYKGKKIVHPAVGTYRGRETDFEELSCGKRKIDNEGLIIAEKMSIEFVGLSSEEDGLYFDPSMDYDFAVGLNNLVMEEEEARKELLGENLQPTDMPIETELLAETTQDVLQDCHRHLILQC